MQTVQEFVDHQVGSGRYSSVSEYVRDLIRDDEKRGGRYAETARIEVTDRFLAATARASEPGARAKLTI